MGGLRVVGSRSRFLRGRETGDLTADDVEGPGGRDPVVALVGTCGGCRDDVSLYSPSHTIPVVRVRPYERLCAARVNLTDVLLVGQGWETLHKILSWGKTVDRVVSN